MLLLMPGISYRPSSGGLTRLGHLSKDFRLCSQIQAAAVSIMSNVAEGFERSHIQEKIQFYNVARGSVGEVRSLLYVISDNFGGCGGSGGLAGRGEQGGKTC
jgi:hypothetical protein